MASEVSERWNKYVDSAKNDTLKDILRNLDLSTAGNKAALKIRLREAVKDFSDAELEKLIPDNLDENYSEADDDENEQRNNDENLQNLDEELERLQNLVKKKEEIAQLKKKLRELEVEDEEVTTRSIGSSFRDIEDSVPAFSGDDTYPVQRWIVQFEESAEVLGLDSRSKFIYGKRLLTGTAKLFMRSVSLKSWKEVKSALLEEFAKKVTKADIHKELRERKKRREESIQQYLLHMQEIASLALIDEEDLIHYVINGIPDSETNKVILYNANNLKELKTALRKYEKIKSNIRDVPIQRDDSQSKKKVSKLLPGNKVKCFNCGEMGHFRRGCTKERKKDHTYNKNGHSSTTSVDKNLVMQLQSNEAEKENIFATEVQCSAVPYRHRNNFEHLIKYTFRSGEVDYRMTLLTLIDSGSPISIIQEQYIAACMMTTVIPEEPSYVGINSSPLRVVGKISSKIYFGNCYTDLDLLVVKQKSMVHPVILGRNFIKINNLVLKKKSEEDQTNRVDDSSGHACGTSVSTGSSNEEEFVTQIMNIDVSNEKSDMVLKINDNLPFYVRDEVKNIVKSGIPTNSDQVPCAHENFKMKIVLTKQDPFFCRPRRLPYMHKLELERILKDLLEKGIIRESNSPYASPIVLVQKKSGEIRLCIDYRELNKVTVRDNFPLPLIEDHLDRLKDKQYYTTLDLKSGFHHVKIDDDSVKYTSFITPVGQYEYLRMPFGLKNAPSVFERYMKHIFGELVSSGKVLSYIDDILIATETIEEHLDVLKQVMEIISKNALQLRLDKCLFLQNEIVYLGYKINVEGTRPSNDHLEAVNNFPVPTCVKDIHSFLGLCSYFRKFIRNFAYIAKPLYDLLKKDAKFSFGPNEYEVFELLKRKLIESPVLAIYSPHNSTELHCDGSSVGFGAVLVQKQKDGKFHPIFYFSKRATEIESKYHSYELETLAIIYALRRFRTYLVGIDFKIITDCQAFTLTLNKKMLNPRISRWALELQSYSYTIEHRNGNKMRHADALSRCVNILNVSDESFEFVLAATQRRDPKIAQIISDLEKSESPYYEMIDGLVYRKVKDRILFYVPEHMEIQIIRTHHEKMCHLGVDKCYEYIGKSYWFPEMKSKIKRYIKTCLKCIFYSPTSGKVEGTLNSIPKGNSPFDALHVDHLGPLANTQLKKQHIFLVIDGFTKFVKLYAVRTTASKETISCLKSYFENYSRPNRIISDRGTSFTSEEFQNFMKENNIQHIKIATQCPQSNGQIERINRVIIPMLSKECESYTTGDWDKHLVKIEFALNNTVNRSTGYSPSMLLFGRNQKGHFCDRIREYLEQTLNCNQKDLDQIRNEASESIVRNQNYNKSRYDKVHKPPTTYKRGDYVMIKNIVNVPGVNKKLYAKYRGPYEVHKVLGNDRYLIKDIEGMQLTRLPYKSVCAPCNMRPLFTHEDTDGSMHDMEEQNNN